MGDEVESRQRLQLLGLWPETERVPGGRLKHHLRALTALLMIVLGVLLPCIHSLIITERDMLRVIEHLQFILSTVMSVVRLAIFWWKKEAVTMVNMIASDWLRSRHPWERYTMTVWAQRIRTIILCGYLLMTVAYGCVVFLPVFGVSIAYVTNVNDSGKPLPLQAYRIYDLTKRSRYELAYISQAIALFLTSVAYIGIDNFLGLLVFHICGQLDILKTHLLCLDRLMRFRDGLRSCVTNHIRLLRAIAVVEDTYNVILLTIFLQFGILFAVYGFRMINIFNEKNVLMSRLPYLISVIVNIFVHMGLYCAIGEILVAQCNGIHYAVCSLEWCSLEPRQTKDLILLMIKSVESSHITAGKVFPMTMITFCNLVKTSVGYISVLLTIRT